MCRKVIVRFSVLSDFLESIKHESFRLGKYFTLNWTKYVLKYMIEGKKFPKVKGESLSGEEVVLPDDAEGNVTLVAVAFRREAQEMVDSWVRYFEELCEEKDSYELPVIESSLWKVFSGFIDRGMKSGIPQEKQDSVITYYGDASDFKRELEIEGQSKGYVFLLDGDGHILFKGEGHVDEVGKEEFLKKVKTGCSREED